MTTEFSTDTRTSHASTLIRQHECPACGAKAGEFCVSRNGNPLTNRYADRVHSAREQAYWDSQRVSA